MFLIQHFFLPHFFDPHFVRGTPSTGVLKLAGVNRTDYLLAGTYQVSESLNNRNTLTFQMAIKPSETEWRPMVGMEVLLESRLCVTGVFERIFGGYVVDVKVNQASCDTVLIIDVSCGDFNTVLERRIAFNIYQPQNVRSVILDIVEQFLKDEEITTEYVNVPPIQLEKYIIPYISVAKAFDEISKATGLFYYVDYFRRLHFFLRSEENSSFSIEGSCGENAQFCAFIKDDGCPDVGIRYGQLKVQETDQNLRNDQFIVAGQGVTRTQKVFRFNGDGETQSFVLPYKLAEMVSIEVDDVEVPSDDRDTGNPVAEWYWTKGEQQISQRDTDTPLNSGQVLKVTFFGFYQVVSNRRRPSSINRMKQIMGRGTGIFQRVHEDENIESFDYAEQYAAGLLDRHSTVPIMISFVTDRYRLKVGQLFPAKLPGYGIRKLATGAQFLIQSVKIKSIQGIFDRYTVTATSSEFEGGWQDFYKKLEKSGKTPKLSREDQISFVFDNDEQVCIGVSVSVGDITDLKPHCPCTDVRMAIGCRAFGIKRIGRPAYSVWY